MIQFQNLKTIFVLPELFTTGREATTQYTPLMLGGLARKCGAWEKENRGSNYWLQLQGLPITICHMGRVGQQCLYYNECDAWN